MIINFNCLFLTFSLTNSYIFFGSSGDILFELLVDRNQRFSTSFALLKTV